MCLLFVRNYDKVQVILKIPHSYSQTFKVIPQSVHSPLQERCSSRDTFLVHNADLQLSFYHPLCYNSRAQCPLLQCLHTTSARLAGAHSYFVISSFKCEGKICCHDLIPRPRSIIIITYRVLMFAGMGCVTLCVLSFGIVTLCCRLRRLKLAALEKGAIASSEPPSIFDHTGFMTHKGRIN